MIIKQISMAVSNEIFFSYAWSDSTGQDREKIVDTLYDTLKEDGYKVVRDKHDLGYRGLITEFIARIGRGKNIVVIISDKYLRSPYCMFELYEVARNSNLDKQQFSEKVYPIIIEFIDFGKPAVINEYLSYWQAQFNEWDELIKNKSAALSIEQFQRFDKIKMVHQNFGKLCDWLINMNSLNPSLLSDNNFATIKKAICDNARSDNSKNFIRTALKEKRGCTAIITITMAVLAIVAFAAIKVFQSKSMASPQNVSVFVHGKHGKQDMVLRKQGHVVMDLKGGERKVADINENGVAYFQNLHIGDSVRLEVDFSEPYKSLAPDSIYVVNSDGRLYLAVSLRGIDNVRGVVLYKDAPLPGVIVSIDMLRDTTDDDGRFLINIPEAEQKQQYNVWFNKKGFNAKSAPAFPQTGEDLNIVMEK